MNWNQSCVINDYFFSFYQFQLFNNLLGVSLNSTLLLFIVTVSFNVRTFLILDEKFDIFHHISVKFSLSNITVHNYNLANRYSRGRKRSLMVSPKDE